MRIRQFMSVIYRFVDVLATAVSFLARCRHGEQFITGILRPPWWHLAGNRNDSKEGNSICQSVRKSAN